MSDVRGEAGPCTVRSSVSWVMVAWNPPCELTDACKNITFLTIENKPHVHSLFWIIFINSKLTFYRPDVVAER